MNTSSLDLAKGDIVFRHLSSGGGSSAIAACCSILDESGAVQVLEVKYDATIYGGGWSATRLLDRILLLLPEKESLQLELLGAYFVWIADDYEQWVDPERNRRNIRHLLAAVASDAREATGPILDFGCGPGLSLEIAREMGLPVEGYDNCVRMRALAAERGLVVRDVHELAKAELRYRGAIASYVFHYPLATAELTMLWRTLRTGAVLMGNVHKGRLLGNFLSRARAAGIPMIVRSDDSLDTTHGEYVMARKVAAT